MRGKGKAERTLMGRDGITPAYAGKSVWYYPTRAATQDHPRLCGEKRPRLLRFCSVHGSPPPMRGKALDKPFSQRRCRITPAYAGKREVCTDRTRSTKDHPRLCGEKALCKNVPPSQIGSPPPMRGKARVLRRWQSATGITPAYAGKREIL